MRDRKLAILAGVAAIAAGSLLLYDAYDRAGIARPFALRFLPV